MMTSDISLSDIAEDVAGYIIKAVKNNGVSPVETQNLASHEQKAQQKLPYPHPNLFPILACETQNFASLLFAARDIKGIYPSCHNNGVSL